MKIFATAGSKFTTNLIFKYQDENCDLDSKPFEVAVFKEHFTLSNYTI